MAGQGVPTWGALPPSAVFPKLFKFGEDQKSMKISYTANHHVEKNFNPNLT
jgi:hypothetical protein